MTFTAPQNAVYQYTKSIAELAYIYGFALVTFWILMSNDVNNLAPFNELYYYNGLSTPTVYPYKGGNVDTLYATAWLDLTNTPVLLTTPDTRQQNRWYTVQLVDIYTNTFANLPGTDKNKPAKQYYIVSPDWDDEDYILPDNVKKVKSPSNIVYLISRVEVKDNDVAGATAVQQQITVSSVIPGAAVLQISPITNSTDIFSTLNFFSTLVQIINYNLANTDDVLLNLYNSIGLSPSKTFNPSALPVWTLQAYTDALTTSLQQIIPFGYQWATGLIFYGDWQAGTKNGVFDNDFVRRAFAASVGAGANVPEEQLYVFTLTDSTGAMLNASAHNYLIHFPKGSFPDVNKKWGFWSITLYTLTQDFYPNSLNRYAVGSNNHNLVYNNDGSLDIYLQHVQPVGVTPTPSSNSAPANWLPAPDGLFELVLRLYSPSSDQIQSISNIPPVVINGSR